MKRKEKVFMVIMLALCVLLFCQRLTGDILHAVLGVIMTIMIVVHMCRHKGKMKYKKFSIRMFDWILIVAIVVLFLTGMLLHPLGGMFVLKILHKLAAVLFAAAVIGHIVQHVREKKK